MKLLCNGKSAKIRAMRPMMFCQICLSAGQIHKINIPYHEIVKTTRYWFFGMGEKGWHAKRYLATTTRIGQTEISNWTCKYQVEIVFQISICYLSAGTGWDTLRYLWKIGFTKTFVTGIATITKTFTSTDIGLEVVKSSRSYFWPLSNHLSMTQNLGASPQLASGLEGIME